MEHKQKMINGEEGEDFSENSHTDFTVELIEKVCHKFTNSSLQPSFHMYMFVWVARRYKELALVTENFEATRKEVNAMFERVNLLEKSFEDWRVLINEIAAQIQLEK